MELKFRIWDGRKLRDPFTIGEGFMLIPSFEHKGGKIIQYTGFKDKNGDEIYNGFILSDVTETDEGEVVSHEQVFWSEPQGAWCLDHSYKQNKQAYTLLAEALSDFEYEIDGHIFNQKNTT